MNMEEQMGCAAMCVRRRGGAEEVECRTMQGVAESRSPRRETGCYGDGNGWRRQGAVRQDGWSVPTGMPTVRDRKRKEEWENVLGR